MQGRCRRFIAEITVGYLNTWRANRLDIGRMSIRAFKPLCSLLK